MLTGGATYSLQDVSGFASSFISSVVNKIKFLNNPKKTSFRYKLWYTMLVNSNRDV